MLSKRNFVMMMTMIIVVLVLFLSSVALKEYFNDYDVNHAAETEIIEQKEHKPDPTGQQVLYVGTMENGYYRAIQEWAEYRNNSLRVFSSLSAADRILRTNEEKKAYVLIDGELLASRSGKAVSICGAGRRCDFLPAACLPGDRRMQRLTESSRHSASAWGVGSITGDSPFWRVPSGRRDPLLVRRRGGP